VHRVLRTTQLASTLLLAALLGLGGCASVLMEGAKKAVEKRQTSDFVTDTQIGTSLFSALAQKDSNLALDINVDVWEQRVLLTGTVADSKTRAEVVRLVHADKRVQKIHDEIQVVSLEEQARRRAAASKRDASKKEGFERFVNDYWIETKIAGQLVSTKDLASTNMRWRSVRNRVYVIGRVSSAGEHRLVIDGIRAVEGVTQVKSFVEIKKYP
jgi:osmotically-inducible protein OsmY